MNDISTKKPVILQILPALSSGGVERGTIDIARAIADQGWGSLVASSGGKMVGQLASCGAEHIELPLNSKNIFTISKNRDAIKQVIEEYNVDIVHVRSRAPAWSAYLATKDNDDVTLMSTFHGTYGTSGIGKKWYNSVMLKGKKTIAVSHFIKDHIQSNYQGYDTDIETIHRGVDVEHFNPASISTERTLQMTAKLNVPDDLPVILLPGRITSWKGQLSFIEALHEIEHKNFYCLIIGDATKHPSYKDKLDSAIEKYNLRNHVRILPDMMDIAAAYKISDLVVSSSLRPEAFGRVIPEAQAMGRLVIATEHGGSCETVIHSETGWLITPGDAKAMAKAIDHALTLSKEKREQITSRAIEHIRENFSLQAMCDKTIKVYQDVLSQNEQQIVVTDAEDEKAESSSEDQDTSQKHKKELESLDA